MAQQSKDTMTDVEIEARRKRNLLLVNVHMLSNISLSLVTFNPRTLILKQLCNGDPVKMSGIMTAWAASIGLLEFLLNPTIGRLSDAYGRKPFFLAAPIACMVLKLAAALNPTLPVLTAEKVICDGLRTLCGTTMCTAALSDLCSGSELAEAFGMMYSWAGVGITLSPFISGRLTASTGSLTAPFFFSAAMAAVQLVVEMLLMEETLPEDKRRPFEGIANPFGMVKLFQQGGPLAIMSTILTLQYLVEPKNLSDTNQLFQINQLKWGSELLSRYTSGVGLGYFLGGPLAKLSLKKLGPAGHTTMTQLVSVIFFGLRWSVPSSRVFWLTLVLSFYAETRQSAIKASATDIAVKSGLGKGEYSGLNANLRALCVFGAPFLYASLYKSEPSRPYFGAATACVLAEALHRAL
jgi:MFS family permease